MPTKKRSERLAGDLWPPARRSPGSGSAASERPGIPLAGIGISLLSLMAGLLALAPSPQIGNVQLQIVYIVYSEYEVVFEKCCHGNSEARRQVTMKRKKIPY